VPWDMKRVMRAAELLRLFVPPFVSALRARLRPAERAYFGPKWPTPAPQSWNDRSTEQVMRSNWPIVVSKIDGTEPLSMLPYKSDQADLTAHNMFMTFLYVLARAAHHKDDLSVLDWGGAVGHYALVARRLLPDVALDYVVKEQPTNCQLARELNPSVKFVSSDDECFSRTYDVVVANSSVHYVEDWKAIVARLAQVTDSWLLINAQPVVRRSPSYVVVQRLWSLGFQGAFFSNVVNRDEFVSEVTRHGFTLVRELMSWGEVPYRGAPEDTTGTGFLFRRS
jgi:putative methyltransferase (TIGR04325 family)